MCYLKTCKTCNKTTWDGCGLHLRELFHDKKKEDICQCNNAYYLVAAHYAK